MYFSPEALAVGFVHYLADFLLQTNGSLDASNLNITFVHYPQYLSGYHLSLKVYSLLVHAGSQAVLDMPYLRK